MTYLGPFIMIGLLVGTLVAIYFSLWAVGGAVLGGGLGGIVAFLLEKRGKKASGPDTD